MPDHERKYPHFLLEGFTDTERYQPPGQPRRKLVPERNRQHHGNNLLGQLRALGNVMERASAAQQDAGLDTGIGLQVEFESFPDIELAFESLARERSGIELLNVRHEGEITKATVFVPEGKLSHFEKLIRDYLEEKHDKRGYPRDHKQLINTIREIRAATLRALWTDAVEAFPQKEDETFWWEVWLPIRGDRRQTIESFRQVARTLNLPTATGELEFPERTVLLARSSAAQLTASMMVLNSVAELRRAKETADFFDTFNSEEQQEWLGDLLNRCQFVEGEDAPYICLLDTGVNNGHPLIAPALAGTDLQTVEPAWGTADDHGHGTQMAGLALVGDLTVHLASDSQINIKHRMESVKLLPTGQGNNGDSRHHGYLTSEAVARPEVTAPNRHRVFGMAVSARDNRDRGRPTAWSAAIDRLASDA